MDLYEKIRTLPTQPGVYLYKNAEGEVIYVGKANNLRSRVRSYLLEASQANAKTGSLMREAVDIDYILVANEHEALALENNLIKQRKPRFNILLRDDKTYPYVKLTLADRFPKVFVTRRLRKDGSAYYGPYFPGNLAYRVVELIHRSFLLPSCKVDLSRYHPRACLQYYIHRCLGPCVEGLTTPEIYKQAVRDAQLFLEGRHAELERTLTARMMAAAEAEQFEAAARLRDQLLHRASAPGKAAHRYGRTERRRRCLRLSLRRRAAWPSISSTCATEKSSTAASFSGKICRACSRIADTRNWGAPVSILKTGESVKAKAQAFPRRRSLLRTSQAALHRPAIRPALHPRSCRFRRP